MPRVSSARRGGSSNRFDKEGGRGVKWDFQSRFFFLLMRKFAEPRLMKCYVGLMKVFQNFPVPSLPSGKLLQFAANNARPRNFDEGKIGAAR